MASRCKVCNLDAAVQNEMVFRLLADELSFDDAEREYKEYDVSRASIHRHFTGCVWEQAPAFKTWLGKRRESLRALASRAVVQGKIEEAELDAEDSPARLVSWLKSKAMLERIMEAAEAEGDTRAVIQASKAYGTVLQNIDKIQEKMDLAVEAEKTGGGLDAVIEEMRRWFAKTVKWAKGELDAEDRFTPYAALGSADPLAIQAEDYPTEPVSTGRIAEIPIPWETSVGDEEEEDYEDGDS